jgi:hypothetical protein
MNNNVNRTIGRASFDLILRFRLKMRMNIETAETKNNYNVLEEVPAARREVELRKRDTNFMRDI